MKIILYAVILLACVGCQTFITSTGKRHYQLFPTKDYSSVHYDTLRYIKQRFSEADFTNKSSYRDGKKLVEVISGEDILRLAATGGRYIIYFWNPCPATTQNIRRLENLSKAGTNVIIVSLRNDLQLIDDNLKQTHFSRYPYFLCDAGNTSTIVLIRKRDIIKKACASCYEKYKDDIVLTDYLLLEQRRIIPVWHNNEMSIFR